MDYTTVSASDISAETSEAKLDLDSEFKNRLDVNHISRREL